MPEERQDNAGSVTLRNVTVRYGGHLALDTVSGTFAPGSLTAVVGANGAGKSTLLAAIAGTVRIAQGEVEAPARRAGRLAYLPQQAAIQRDYPLTVSELITVGAWRKFGAFRAPGAALRSQVKSAAHTTGLADRLDRRIEALSVGELQRALFARLILSDAAVILLDEPFAAVDAATTTVLLHQIDRWHAEGRTVIAVLHDLALVEARFPDTVVLSNRRLAWGPTATSLGELAA